jgi:GNAT superfamily N-acetyltransferase
MRIPWWPLSGRSWNTIARRDGRPSGAYREGALKNGMSFRTVDEGSLEEIRGHLETYAHLPYTCYREMTPQASVALVLNEIKGLLRGGGFCLLGEKDGSAAGLVTGHVLDWDSDQLGVTAGRLAHLLAWEPHVDAGELVSAAVTECGRRGIIHLSGRVPAGDTRAIHALEESGFQLMECLLTFGFRFGRDEAGFAHSGSLVEPCDGSEEEIRWVGDLAAGSFHLDRFHVDPRLSGEKADALHREWMENSCRGFADVVLVARDPRTGARLGFLTCKKHRTEDVSLPLTFANVVLVAVDPGARGLGVSSDLTLAAMDWARDRVDILEVGTQYTNIAASRLYIRAGFRYVRSDVSLRLWMP